MSAVSGCQRKNSSRNKSRSSHFTSISPSPSGKNPGYPYLSRDKSIVDILNNLSDYISCIDDYS